MSGYRRSLRVSPLLVKVDQRHVLRLWQAADQPDGVRSGHLEAFEHALAHVEQHADVQGRGEVGAGEVPRRDVFHVPKLAVFVDLEVVE